MQVLAGHDISHPTDEETEAEKGYAQGDMACKY